EILLAASVGQVAIQGRFGESPETVGGRARNAEAIGGLLLRHAAKIAELHQFSRLGGLFGEVGQSFVNGQDLLGFGVDQVANRVQLDPDAIVTAGGPQLLAGAFDENSPHCLGGRAKKMAATTPLLKPFDIDETNIGFVYERGGV